MLVLVGELGLLGGAERGAAAAVLSSFAGFELLVELDSSSALRP